MSSIIISLCNVINNLSGDARIYHTQVNNYQETVEENKQQVGPHNLLHVI